MTFSSMKFTSYVPRTIPELRGPYGTADFLMWEFLCNSSPLARPLASYCEGQGRHETSKGEVDKTLDIVLVKERGNGKATFDSFARS